MATRPGYEPAEPSLLPKIQIFELAEGVADKLGYRPGDDIHEIVEQIGGRLSVETTLLNDPERTGSLYVDGIDDFEIIVPSHTSLLRDRFTIAHELGHYFLHYVLPNKLGRDIPQKVVALRKGSNRIEWEANWFAAAFLMPAKQFKSALKKFHGSHTLIAREFGVSERAVEVRVDDLAL